MKEIKKKTVELIIESPIACTDEQFNEWIEYLMGFTMEANENNPLINYELVGCVDTLSIDNEVIE